MKTAAKEKQRAAYDKAKERNRAALAEAKKRQRAAYKKAKERRQELVAIQKKERQEREATERAERDAALIKKLVRPATIPEGGAASPALSAVTARLTQASEQEVQPPTNEKPARPRRPRPVQLALGNLNVREE